MHLAKLRRRIYLNQVLSWGTIVGPTTVSDHSVQEGYRPSEYPFLIDPVEVFAATEDKAP